MSLTVVQRFYEFAKQSSDAPALVVQVEDKFQDLPWWFVKSKAKHFGLGLLQEGAARGDYFYLFAGVRPNWVYAELGALTMELQILNLPANLSSAGLETLMRRFPPAFFMSSPELYGKHGNVLKGQKSLRRLIWDSDQIKCPALPGISLPPLSFREVFNSGIIHEKMHHPKYREHRRALHDQSIISPIQVSPDGLIAEAPLNFAALNQFSAKLSQRIRQKKIRRLFAFPNLSVTLARAASLYWPLSLGMACVLPDPHGEWLHQVRQTASSGACFGATELSELERWAGEQNIPSKARLLRRLRLKWKIRHHFGRKFQALLAIGKVPDALHRLLESRIALVEISPEDLVVS